MTQQKDLCPLNIAGDHRYFIFKTVEVFEPVVVDSIYKLSPNNTYYQKVEYALMGCNCGSAVKAKVKEL